MRTLIFASLISAIFMLSPAAQAASGGTGAGAVNGVTTQDLGGNVAAGSGASAAGSGLQASIAIGQGASALSSSIAIGPGATAPSVGIAVGAQAQADDTGAVALGVGASAQSNGGVAIGIGASSNSGTAPGAIAIGSNSSASGAGSVALGIQATDGGQANVVSVGSQFQQRRIINVAPGIAPNDAVNLSQAQAGEQQGIFIANTYTNSQIQALQNILNQATTAGICARDAAGGIVCGHGANAAAGAVAQGDNASAGYSGSLALGTGATITAPTNPADPNTTGAIAIGQGARANADPATAIGYQANAAGANSVALGYQAQAYGNNSVALGAGSVANRPNSVSVGSAGQARQIANVAPGTMPTDAVNLGQLDGLIGQATSGILSQANQHADEVAAMAAATSMTPEFGPKGYALTAAVAGVGGQSAFGIGFARAFHFHQYPAYWQASVGFNGGSGSAAVKLGGSIGW